MRREVAVSRTVYLLIAGAAVFGLYRVGLLNPWELGPAAARLADFTSSLFPPDIDVLPTLLAAMLETVQMAFLGTLLGFLIALPLSFLGARNLFPPVFAGAVRLVIGSIRTIPSLLWAVVFVVGFGLGPAAGIVAIAFYTIGYLGKLYYEAFESVDPEVLEAVRSVGSNRAQLIVYAVLPESANAILSQLFFMFEYNIRASTIMGFVGAGGIGFYMLGYVQLLQYQSLLTALLLTLGVVMAVDYLSGLVRSLVLPSAPKGRGRAPLLAGIIALWR